MDWTEDYTDPLEEIRRAQEADRGATDKAQMLADLQRNADMIISRRLQARQKASPIDDNLKAFILSKKLEGDEASRDLAERKLERTNIDDGPAPADWGAPAGMTRAEALRAGYARAPKPASVDAPEEMAPEDWHDRLRTLGIAHPEQMYRKEAMRLLSADVGRQGQVEASIGAETRRGEREAPENLWKKTQNLRQEFQGQQVYKDTQAVATAYEKIQSAQPTAAGDISLVYGYMRMMDPGSTVREGEFATAQNAGSIPERIRSAYNKAVSGQRLDPNIRQAFKAEATQVLQAQKRRYDQLAQQYSDLALRNGIPSEEVVLNIGLPEAAPKRKKIGGKTYEKRSDGWYEVQ